MLVKADGLTHWVGEPLQVTIDTATVHYEDNRPPEEIKVAPYVVTRKFPINIETLWTKEDLLAIGLLRVIPATLLDGKEWEGDSTYERDGDVVREVRAAKDLPPPPETVTISVDEHERLKADAEKWRIAVPVSRE